MQMEEFSYAYVHAVASVAGYSVERIKVDYDSIDLLIKSDDDSGEFTSPQIDCQLKSTGQARVIHDDAIKFPLPMKNYRKLRGTKNYIERILVVVVVPPQVNDWITQSDERLAMCHCGYWTSLKGYPESQNIDNVTIEIPKTQQFSVDTLKQLINRIASVGHL